MRGKDILNQKFGRLTVIEFVKSTGKPYYNIEWKCICDCGKVVTVLGCSLRCGNTTSCGCYKKELDVKKCFKHGLKNHRLYKIWQLMKNRCLNSNSDNFNNYGGRGISVCNQWLDFQTFYNWGISNGYDSNLTLDRIDVNGNYEPLNCRWATHKEQSNNKRKTLYFSYNNTKVTVSDIIDMHPGLKKKKLYYRLCNQGFSVSDAILSLL